jgi:hypothetical protein
MTLSSDGVKRTRPLDRKIIDCLLCYAARELTALAHPAYLQAHNGPETIVSGSRPFRAIRFEFRCVPNT